MYNAQDVKVMWGDTELLVRNVEVSYTCDDLPSVSIEGFMPREQTMEFTVEASADKVMRDIIGVHGETEPTGPAVYTGVDYADGPDSMVMAHYSIEDGKIKQLQDCEIAAWTTKEKEDMEMARGYDGNDCEKACSDDGSYGAHGLAKKVVNLGLDERQKLIKKYELTQDDGTLTQRGRELLLTLLFDIYEDEVVDALTSLEEQRKADRE